MTNIFAQSGDLLEDFVGKKASKVAFPIEMKAKKKQDDATKKAAADLETFRISQEPAERVTTIAEDAAAQKRRKASSISGSGKQSTILSGVQKTLKARLGE